MSSLVGGKQHGGAATNNKDLKPKRVAAPLKNNELETTYRCFKSRPEPPFYLFSSLPKQVGGST